MFPYYVAQQRILRDVVSIYSPRLVLDKGPCLHRPPTGSQDPLYGQKVH